MNKKPMLALSIMLVTTTISSISGCSASEKKIDENSSTSANSSALVTINTDISDLDDSSVISDTLYGLFLEDINFAIDGGMYTELVKNRSFEYGTTAANGNLHGWANSNPDVLSFSVSDGSADGTWLNENNPHYAVLSNDSDTDYAGIANVGFLEGMAVTADANYDVSFYIKGNDDFSGSVRVALEDADGTVYAETYIDSITDSWAKYETVLTPDTTVNENLRFCVQIPKGSVNLDMVSVMPQDSYKDLPIRKDIGEYFESLNPSFLRFPGGCVIEGKDLESMYSWKDSIGNGLEFTVNGETTVGDVAARPQGKSIWSGTANDPYYTTYGIGFYEFFQLCEALDCMPVPVLNAGMTCEVQSSKYTVYPINSEEFQQCIQDALDLVEFCLGDASTYWGSVRIAMGHEATFPLTYIGIGNEQWQTEYHAHYTAFVEAFETARQENPSLYGDIQLIVANGTASGSTEGWDYLDGNPDSVTTLVDEHYYESPNWFFSNTDRYDSYDRASQAQVFLGEYAAQSNTLQAALAEAAYMTGLEENADVVKMACYAPLLGNSKSNQWTPDMIFYSNDSLFGTANYYVQKLYSENVGTNVLSSDLTFTGSTSDSALAGKVGLGSWMTSVAYDNLEVTDNESGDVLYSNDFEDTASLKEDGWDLYEGSWSISDGQLIQTNTGDPGDVNTGDAAYIGDADWSDYTLTVDATITGGSEGFLIPVCVKNNANQIFWNLGGWGNTVSCLQIVDQNTKSGQVTGTVKNCTLEKNKTYQLKVVVSGDNIKCYLGDTLYVDYTYATAPTFFETASVDENGDLIIKFVNSGEQSVEVSTVLENFDADAFQSKAAVTTLTGEELSLTNSFENPTAIAPVESTMDITGDFTFEVSKYSLTIIRIPRK